MLTSEASANREWDGLQIIRHLLRDRRAPFISGFYPTSISDSTFDAVRRAAITGSLIDAERDALLSPAAIAGLSSDAAAALLNELAVVAQRLRGVSAMFAYLADQVDDVRSQAYPVIDSLRMHSSER